MINRILYIIIICFISFSTFGNNESLYNDSTYFELRKIEPNTVDKYISDSDFDYKTKDLESGESFFSILWDYFLNFLKRLFNFKDRQPSSIFFRLIFLLISVSFLVYFLYRTRLSNLLVFRGDEKIDLMQHEDNIFFKDYHQLISNAENNNDFRLATRYKFMELLHNLDKSKLIVWKSYKTNFDYLNELNSKGISDFASISNFYDNIWYGEYLVDKQEYDGYCKKINSFTKNFSS